MTRRHVFAVFAGLIAMTLTQYCGVELHQVVYEHCCQSPGPAAIYVGAGMKVLSEILYLVPGFVAGFIARTRGIFTGFVTGILGGAVASAFSASLLLGVSAWTELSTTAAVVGILSAGIVSGTVGAAAGGAAELLRSKRV